MRISVLERVIACARRGLGLVLLGSVALSAQPQDTAAPSAGAPPWAREVDALFAAWDRPDSPGCALAVIQDGAVVHARGFGQASLEHSVPIGPETVFDIGSTSKQFTAAAIGLLVQDGKLAVTDEIHEWVQELAWWDKDVTLDHLLHHTSGLPDYLNLMLATGIDEADVTTPQDALDALVKVDELRFEPGTRFEYSNTNYFLLSLVVERATKEPFADFARERIFEPLGMTSTLLFHDHALVVPHRASGYRRRKEGGFAVQMSDFEQLGDGAVQTSVLDLAKWDANFYSHAVGGAALQEFLHHVEPLPNGAVTHYARGLVVDDFQGERRVQHAGAWAGYRAQLVRFPERKTSVILLANLADMNPNDLCDQVSALVLGAGR